MRIREKNNLVLQGKDSVNFSWVFSYMETHDSLESIALIKI